MPDPVVSIILPVLNTIKYLPLRVESILSQSVQKWELIVVDGYSNDGSWEFLQTLKDSRITLSQRERQGIYDAWNFGITRARGKYVYIATSDDTMEKDCLEKLIAALQQNPVCGFAHCNLKIIDDTGKHLKGKWENDFLAQKFYRDYLNIPHVRKAPLDGILHFGLGTIFHSITQLLIRKDIFEEIGLFSDEWGSGGDFEWGMKASLAFDSVHVPQYLASWRVHDAQATPSSPPADLFIRHIQMTLSAVEYLRTRNPQLYTLIRRHWNTLQKLNKLNQKKINQKRPVRSALRSQCSTVSWLDNCLANIERIRGERDIHWKIQHMKTLADKILGNHVPYIQ